MANDPSNKTYQNCLELSHDLGLQYKLETTKEHKKKHGQFMTPPKIASFMAKNLTSRKLGNNVRILDPATGTGILISALIDELLKKKKKPLSIEITAYEIDPFLIEKIKKIRDLALSKAESFGILLKFEIIHTDFLLSCNDEKYDLIITNPPFFKIKKDDPRAALQKEIIYGQPNIYGLFMGKCSELLQPNGRACYLTPRSWTSGKYFTKLRIKLRKINLYAAHLFESREAPFASDRIQQESMITWFEKTEDLNTKVNLSFSIGDTDIKSRRARIATHKEIFPRTEDGSLVLSQNPKKFSICALKHSLSFYGITASTGKVVPFRTKEYLHDKCTSTTAPLYWMQHVLPMKITWPVQMKNQNIQTCPAVEKLGIKGDSNYVLVRRFSPRDSLLHVIAAPLLIKNGTRKIFIENHLNYIYKKENSLTTKQAIGLSFYLNSLHVANYFSERLGHTQINAGDLNKLPSPTLLAYEQIGNHLLAGIGQPTEDELIDYISGGRGN